MLMASRIAAPHGATVKLENYNGNGHSKLVIRLNGNHRSIGISHSPADQTTAVWNAERDVKRLMRELLA